MQTSLRAISNRAAKDKAHRFGNLYGLLGRELSQVVFLATQSLYLRIYGMDQNESQPEDFRIYDNPEVEVPRVLELLWCHRQFRQSEDIPLPDGTHTVQVA